MPKKRKKQTSTPTESKYPSRFGSHRVMVEEELDKIYVICKDDRGLYLTKKFRLDNGLSDPGRWGATEYRELKLREHKDLEILRERHNG